MKAIPVYTLYVSNGGHSVSPMLVTDDMPAGVAQDRWMRVEDVEAYLRDVQTIRSEVASAMIRLGAALDVQR